MKLPSLQHHIHTSLGLALLYSLLAITQAGCGGGAAESKAAADLKALGVLIVKDVKKHTTSIVMPNDAEQMKPAAELLPKLVYLTSFGANYTPISDDDLVYVGKLKGLTNVQLVATSVSDVGISHLAGLSKLSSLNLAETKITSAALADIGKLGNLTILNLSNCSVDDGYASLSACEKLEWLVLGGLSVSNAAVDDLLKIPNLKRVSLVGADITPDGVQKLQGKGLTLDLGSAPSDGAASAAPADSY